jgi:hypothetical protein
MRPVPACGTVAAYSRHLRLKELIDPDCREAARLYLVAYRAEHPERVSCNRSVVAAKAAAVRRLIALHIREYETLLAEERAAQGLPVRRRKQARSVSS